MLSVVNPEPLSCVLIKLTKAMISENLYSRRRIGVHSQTHIQHCPTLLRQQVIIINCNSYLLFRFYLFTA